MLFANGFTPYALSCKSSRAFAASMKFFSAQTNLMGGSDESGPYTPLSERIVHRKRTIFLVST